MTAAGAAVCFLCRKRRDLPEIIIVITAVIFASTPLFLDYLLRGHDSLFQLNRILGVRDALKTGMFPVRMNGYAFWGYGYADPVFYPQLFLYIPAVLCVLGMPFIPAVECFLLLINGATAAIMYGSAKVMFKSSRIACCSAVLYVLSMYRLSNLYTRVALGEALAMMFFPLVVCGLYELFYGDEKHWYLLVLAFTGVFQSHIISSVLTALICVGVGICSLKRLLDRKRLIALGKVLAFSLLLNVWFLVPLLDYMGTEISTSNLQRQFWDRVAPWSIILQVCPRWDGGSPLFGWDMSDVMALSPGLGILCGMAAFVVYWIRKNGKPEKKAKVLFVSGVLFLVAASNLCPWFLLVKLPFVQTLVSYIQFPWRLVGEAVCALSFACGYIFWRIGQSAQAEKPRFGTWLPVYLGVLALSLVTSQHYLDELCGQPAGIYGEADIPSPISDGIPEYRYPGTDASYLSGFARPSDDRVTVLESGNTVLSAYCSYQVSGDSMENVYLEMPALYYPGYHAVDEDGRELPIERGTSNVVRAFPLDQSGTICVYFKERRLWRLAELVSLVSFAGFISAVICEKRRKTELRQPKRGRKTR